MLPGAGSFDLFLHLLLIRRHLGLFLLFALFRAHRLLRRSHHGRRRHHGHRGRLVHLGRLVGTAAELASAHGRVLTGGLGEEVISSTGGAAVRRVSSLLEVGRLCLLFLCLLVAVARVDGDRDVEPGVGLLLGAERGLRGIGLRCRSVHHGGHRHASTVLVGRYEADRLCSDDWGPSGGSDSRIHSLPGVEPGRLHVGRHDRGLRRELGCRGSFKTDQRREGRWDFFAVGVNDPLIGGCGWFFRL